MPGRGGNQKSFERPKDRGDRMHGVHDNRLEGREIDYRTMGGYVKEPIMAAASKAKNAGAVKGSGSQKPRKGPEHSRTKGKVAGRKN
jgi:hypothetical protein